MFLSFKRILISGWGKFAKDRSSTAAALVVMVVVLLGVSSLFLLRAATSFLVAALLESVDVSAYLADTVSQEQSLEIRRELLSIEEVKGVEYVSKDEALKRFIHAHQGDQAVLDSLDAIGANPFLASLNIQAEDPSQYAKISEFLEKGTFASLITEVDYLERASVIERLSAITSGIRTGVLAAILLMACIAVLVVFNTIRLTIYNSKKEIEIMRLVGASNWFIRGPFLVQGILVGTVASIVTLGLVFAAASLTVSSVESFTGFSVFDYLKAEFLTLFGLQLAVGIGLGVLSSAIAIRKYLQV